MIERIIAIKASQGNRFKNGGRHSFINFLTAFINLYGFGIAHNTSIIHTIIFSNAVIKLYIDKKGLNILNRFIMPFSNVAAKLSICGLIIPPGQLIFRALSISNIFSGNPSGSLNPGIGNCIGENGIPNPGKGSPGLTGGCRLLSDGEQGAII
jgi:hypothetical protein